MRPILTVLIALIAVVAPAQQTGLDPACAAGNATACVDAASRLLKTGKAADTVSALAHHLKGCDLNNGLACASYGYALEFGLGTAPNPNASSRYFLRGCELGAPVACNNYGNNVMGGRNGVARDSAKGAGYLARACSADYQYACVSLALAERAGLAGHTTTDALARLIGACDKNNARGCVQAGYSLRDSLGVPADLPASVSFFKRACDQPGISDTDPANAGEGCSSLAWAYQNGIGVARNEGRATTLYRRGCDLGAAYSCYGLGLVILNSTGAPDTSAAAALFSKACGLRGAGQAAGCGNYGHLLTVGWREQRADSVPGRRLLEQSCNQDFIVGCRWLGEAARNGVGASRDTAAAVRHFTKACDRRDGPACFELGYAYSNGQGVSRDMVKAQAFYEIACGTGHSNACNNLGVALRDGSGGPPDRTRAVRLFEQECQRSNFRSCANLGYSHEYGRGVPVDESRAMALYKQSCLKADAYGCSQLKRLAPDSLAILGATVRGDSARAVGTSAGSQPTVDAAPDASRGLWALVVGLSRYASTEIRPLAYARKDAESFAKFLMTPQGGGFPADHVQLLVDEKATADALRRGLHTFLRRANQGDLVIIYFAGHGRQPGNEAGIPYFLTYDTDPREMAATAVPMDELRRAVQQSITARYIVAFVDACHSGGVTLSTRGSGDNDLINRYLRELAKSKETVVTLAASQENQESLEGPEYGGGHGAFTWHLIQALGGEADRVSEGGDESGTVTLSELASYVTRKVKAATRNLQEPSLSYLKWDPSLVLSVIRPR